jgi:hypothetical protein
MRTRLPAFLIAIACAAPAAGANRTFQIAGFEHIRVEGPFKVVLTTGVPPSAKASGPQSGLDRLAVEIVGRTLVIQTSLSAWGGSSDSHDSGPVEVRIGTHELNGAALTGAGSLEINQVKGLSFDVAVEGAGQIVIASADVDQFTASLIGTASSVVVGRAGTLKLTTRGVSSFDGSGLVAKDATMTVNGASTIKAGVSNSAKIDATGPANVTLTGGPSCTTRLSGSASVSGCRKSQ